MARHFETSIGRTSHKRLLLLEASAGGVTGYAECAAGAEPYYLPETLETARHVLKDFLIPIALGREVEDPRSLAPALNRVRGHEMAKAALEMAVWELAARCAAKPLFELFGGQRRPVPAGVALGLASSTEELCETVARELEAGYGRIKVKIAPGRDAAPLAALRRAFPDVSLSVDANGSYEPEQAEQLRSLDDFRLEMLEQPLAWDDLLAHAELQAGIETPICLDESIRSPSHARLALRLGACRVVNLKVARVGGIAPALAVHDHCTAAATPLLCGGMLESGIGRLFNVHLQTLPGFTLTGDTSASARYYPEDLVEPPVKVAPDGTIAVPSGPGIGHDIVWPRVEAATRFREEWRA